MYEFNFDSSKLNEEVVGGSGGFQILDAGRYDFQIKDISPARETARGDLYRLITFEEVKSRVSFNEFLTVGVADDSQQWRIDNFTAPLVYRLCQCAKTSGADWYDELVGRTVSIEIDRKTQERKTRNVDDFGNAETKKIEVNTIKRGKFADVIQPAATGAGSSKMLDDLQAFLNVSAADE